MAITPYSGETQIIQKLGTTPQERGLTTEQFKAKFDQYAEEFVAWFNTTHKAEMEAIQEDVEELKNTTGLQAHLDDIMPHQSGLSSYASSPDSNGIYTVVDYKRSNGTLYMKSTLSGGTSPNYTTDTWQFYDDAGTNVIATKVWTLTYDGNGKIVSKVVA
jgi:hypothetical protein